MQQHSADATVMPGARFVDPKILARIGNLDDRLAWIHGGAEHRRHPRDDAVKRRDQPCELRLAAGGDFVRLRARQIRGGLDKTPEGLFLAAVEYGPSGQHGRG